LQAAKAVLERERIAAAREPTKTMTTGVRESSATDLKIQKLKFTLFFNKRILHEAENRLHQALYREQREIT
jgi:hypothetical protein